MQNLLLGDSTEYMLTIPNKFYSIGCVDPEYGIGESSKNHKSRNTPVKQKNGKTLKAPNPTYIQSDWDNQPPSFVYFRELFRTTVNQIIWGANYFSEIVGTTFKPPRRKDFDQFLIDYPVGWIIWDKLNGSNDFNDCELAWTSFDRPSYIIPFMWNGMLQGKSISQGHIQQGNKKLNEKRIHPTQKPVAIYLHLFQIYCTRDSTILDTHLGSASSASASLIFCNKLFTGIEKDLFIFNSARKRYKEYSSRNLLF